MSNSNVKRIVTVSKELDDFALELALGKDMDISEYYGSLLHTLLDSLHTMKYTDLKGGYQSMSQINLSLSKMT